MATVAWVKTMQRSAVRQIARLAEERDRIVVIDTETTGLSHSNDAFVQLAIIDGYGKTLLNTYVNPEMRVSDNAFKVHKISNADVADAPTFKDIYEEVHAHLFDKIVLIYNATYDSNLLMHQCERYNVEPFAPYTWEDVMLPASQVTGMWSTTRKAFSFVKLSKVHKLFKGPEYQQHDALHDCKATLRVFNAMLQFGIDATD